MKAFKRLPSEDEIARELGITPKQWRAWQQGEYPFGWWDNFTNAMRWMWRSLKGSVRI